MKKKIESFQEIMNNFSTYWEIYSSLHMHSHLSFFLSIVTEAINF